MGKKVQGMAKTLPDLSLDTSFYLDNFIKF